RRLVAQLRLRGARRHHRHRRASTGVRAPQTVMSDTLTFKIATDRWELEQIHELNYRTFVEEIPQHRGNPDRALIDRFHGDNTYFVGKRGARVVGMIAVRSRRPFSLDEKLPDLDRYLPAGWTFCE